MRWDLQIGVMAGEGTGVIVGGGEGGDLALLFVLRVSLKIVDKLKKS